MTRIHEANILNAEAPQLIIENDLMTVLLQPEIGGRILDVETKSSNGKGSSFPFLHRTYPKPVQFGPYTEYGGIEECIGSPLTSRLWKTPWRVDRREDCVTLSVISSTRFSKILLSKTISLIPDAPILKIEYSFTNFDQKFNKFTFGIHPELCLGNALKNNAYHVPVDDEVLSGGFTALGDKQFIMPCEGWAAVTYDGMAFGMLFTPDVIDNIEVYYPRIGTHFVLQPLIYGVGLSPNRRASFVSMLYFGEGDVNTIQELYAQKLDELTMSYEPIEPPAVHVVDETWLLPRRPQVTLPFEEFGQISFDTLNSPEQPPLQHQIPEIEVPHGNLQGGVPTLQQPPLEIPRPLNIPVAETVEIPNIPKILRESRRLGQLPITDIRLSNVNGCIFVEGWDEDTVSLETVLQASGRTEEEATRLIEDARPEVIQHDKLLLVRARGEAQQKVVINQHLRVPKGKIRLLELNFVNGKATVADVQPARLKIRSTEGIIILTGEIAEDAEYDVNTTNGRIDVKFPDAAECTIHASSVTGTLKCNLDLIDADNRINWIHGVYNAPKANIRLNSISGDIILNNECAKQKRKNDSVT